jgi:hypothetical protein
LDSGDVLLAAFILTFIFIFVGHGTIAFYSTIKTARISYPQDAILSSEVRFLARLTASYLALFTTEDGLKAEALLGLTRGICRRPLKGKGGTKGLVVLHVAS